jgi:hypothetical protein
MGKSLSSGPEMGPGPEKMEGPCEKKKFKQNLWGKTVRNLLFCVAVIEVILRKFNNR